MPIDIDAWEKAIREEGGYLDHVAARLGVASSTVARRIQHSKRLTRVLQETLESHVDNAERKVHDLMKCGNPKIELDAATRFLNAKAKHRGWGKQKTAEQGKPKTFDIEYIPAEKYIEDKRKEQQGKGIDNAETEDEVPESGSKPAGEPERTSSDGTGQPDGTVPGDTGIPPVAGPQG